MERHNADALVTRVDDLLASLMRSELPQTARVLEQYRALIWSSGSRLTAV
jgi:hypothetical protein